MTDAIKSVFEPRYKRKLAENEIVDIANNLIDLVDMYTKFKWKQKYGYKISGS